MAVADPLEIKGRSLSDNDVLERRFAGKRISDELLGAQLARALRRAWDSDVAGETQSFDEMLVGWIEEAGIVGIFDAPPVGGLGLVVRRWHVATSRLRWQALLFVPLFVGNMLLSRGLSPTDLHGLLTSLQTVVTRLSREERLLLDRLRDQGKCLDGSTRELLGVGLTADDRTLIDLMIDVLLDVGVLEQSESGRLTTVR